MGEDYFQAWAQRNTRPVSRDEYTKAVKKADKFGSGSRFNRLYAHIKVAQWTQGMTLDEATQFVYQIADSAE